MTTGRFVAKGEPTPAEGWAIERLTPPSSLYAANGLRDGPDGRLYIAQCIGGQIGALDPDTGALETIAAIGGDIVGPDDIAFDSAGNLYVTECMNARVSVIEPGGGARVLRDDLPGANGITCFRDRLFVDECRLGGRLLEVALDGSAVRVLLEGLDLPNALEVGPDGYLYFPLVGASEIWRVHPDAGAAERVCGGLDNPVAVKFDRHGFIVSPQSHSGEVLRIDPKTGARETLATLPPGLDNIAFLDGRLFVSHHTTGQISEIAADGQVEVVLGPGLMFPLDIACDPAGQVFLADNSTIYRVSESLDLVTVGRIFASGFPGSARGIAVDGGRLLVTTNDGRAMAFHPDAQRDEQLLAGLDQPAGIAPAGGGQAFVVESGAGRVLRGGTDGYEVVAERLARPMGIAVASSGDGFVTESGGGRIVRLSGAGAAVVTDDVVEPQGIAERDGVLYVVDVGRHAILAIDAATGASRVLASNLPVGPPPGVTPKPLLGMPPLSGPFGPFAGIAVSQDGSLYFSADTEGSLMRLRPSG